MDKEINENLNKIVKGRAVWVFERCFTFIKEALKGKDYSEKDCIYLVKVISDGLGQLAFSRGFSEEVPLLGLSIENMKFVLSFLDIHIREIEAPTSWDSVCQTQFLVWLPHLNEDEKDVFDEDEDGEDSTTTIFTEYIEDNEHRDTHRSLRLSARKLFRSE